MWSQLRWRAKQLFAYCCARTRCQRVAIRRTNGLLSEEAAIDADPISMARKAIAAAFSVRLLLYFPLRSLPLRWLFAYSCVRTRYRLSGPFSHCRKLLRRRFIVECQSAYALIICRCC